LRFKESTREYEQDRLSETETRLLLKVGLQQLPDSVIGAIQNGVWPGEVIKHLKSERCSGHPPGMNASNPLAVQEAVTSAGEHLRKAEDELSRVSPPAGDTATAVLVKAAERSIDQRASEKAAFRSSLPVAQLGICCSTFSLLVTRDGTCLSPRQRKQPASAPQRGSVSLIDWKRWA